MRNRTSNSGSSNSYAHSAYLGSIDVVSRFAFYEWTMSPPFSIAPIVSSIAISESSTFYRRLLSRGSPRGDGGSDNWRAKGQIVSCTSYAWQLRLATWTTRTVQIRSDVSRSVRRYVRTSGRSLRSDGERDEKYIRASYAFAWCALLRWFDTWDVRLKYVRLLHRPPLYPSLSLILPFECDS